LRSVGHFRGQQTRRTFILLIVDRLERLDLEQLLLVGSF